MLAILGIILLIAVVFVGGGLLGWVLKGVEFIFGFLSEGCSNTIGCLVIVFFAFVLLLGLL